MWRKCKCVFQKSLVNTNGISYLMIKCLQMLICHIVMPMIWDCHMQHPDVWQISQFAKSIHNSSPISLASWCRLLCYPREDRCESKALWDPDGTFPTIRFGLPLENDPFPVCDTNVSLSAGNEMKPANEKNSKILFLFASGFALSWFQLKANVSPWWPVNHATNHMHMDIWCEEITVGKPKTQLACFCHKSSPKEIFEKHVPFTKLFIFSAQEEENVKLLIIISII